MRPEAATLWLGHEITMPSTVYTRDELLKPHHNA